MKVFFCSWNFCKKNLSNKKQSAYNFIWTQNTELYPADSPQGSFAFHRHLGDGFSSWGPNSAVFWNVIQINIKLLYESSNLTDSEYLIFPSKTQANNQYYTKLLIWLLHFQ